MRIKVYGMQIIHQSELDKVKWDLLVEKSNADVFSLSWYLDACALDWCVLVDEAFENGIALPYSNNLGIKALTPPIFTRNLDFLGENEAFRSAAFLKIKEEFKIGQLQFCNPIEIPATRERVFQTTDSSIFEIQKHGKRMLNKAKKEEISIRNTEDWQTIFEIISTELSEKIAEFNDKNLNKLRQLIEEALLNNKLIVKGIYFEGTLQGGMLYISSPTSNLYLKGSALPEAKKLGGMYLCMHTFILETLDQNKTFDFGGSSVEGVQRFNYNLGGKDKVYYIYEWDFAPWWYHLTRKIYHLFKKK